MTMRLLVVAAMSFLAGAARADVDSGPKAGEKVGELKVTAVVGGNEGKEVNVVADRKDAPTVYLFVRSDTFDRPVFRFLKTLDGKLGDAGETVRGVAVWVGEDAEKDKAYIERAKGSLKFASTSLTVSGAGKAGPNGWGINSDAHITAVLVNKGKVVKSFAFVSVNETDVPAVVAELKKAVGK